MKKIAAVALSILMAFCVGCNYGMESSVDSSSVENTKKTWEEMTEAERIDFLDVEFDDVYYADLFYELDGDGNNEAISVKNTPTRENSPLKNKTFAFLGSSETVGAMSDGEAFPQYLAKRNDCTSVVHAKSGATLCTAYQQVAPYVEMLKNFSQSQAFDGFFVCLSPNDSWFIDDFGTVSDGFDIDSFDQSKTYGALEYILAYAKQTWGCDLYVYTDVFWVSDTYPEMIENAKLIAKKWGAKLIDLYSDKEFNDINQRQRMLYMADDVHPLKAGYRFWWTPQFEKYILSIK